LVFHSSTITMMHGPINIRSTAMLSNVNRTLNIYTTQNNAPTWHVILLSRYWITSFSYR